MTEGLGDVGGAPASRSRVIARFRRVAMTCGPLPAIATARSTLLHLNCLLSRITDPHEEASTDRHDYAEQADPQISP
jgi:hypothetical protein